MEKLYLGTCKKSVRLGWANLMSHWPTGGPLLVAHWLVNCCTLSNYTLVGSQRYYSDEALYMI